MPCATPLTLWATTRFLVHNFAIFIIQILNFSSVWKCHVWVWLNRVYEHVLIVIGYWFEHWMVSNLTDEFVLQAKVASIMASFIIHKPPQRSPFSKAALKTVDSAFKSLFMSVVMCCANFMWCDIFSWFLFLAGEYWRAGSVFVEA